MKGLLLKDWYVMKKYCRSYVVIAVVFIAVSLVSDENMFFIFYPCLLCSMIPITLLGYDERSRWVQYSGSLPYTKAQFVCAKYLIGLIAQIVMLTVIGIAQGIKMSAGGNFLPDDFIVLMSLVLIMSTFASSITLPFIFKWGVEKGRIAYYVMIGLVCAAGFLAAKYFNRNLQIAMQANMVLTALVIAGIGAYIISWYLSVVFYKKREIQ